MPEPPEVKTINPETFPVDFQLLHVSNVAFAQDAKQLSETLDDFIEHYSSWQKLKTTTAWIRRFLLYIKDESLVPTGKIKVEELQSAEQRIISMFSKENFLALLKSCPTLTRYTDTLRKN